jgi:hypothetical protein
VREGTAYLATTNSSSLCELCNKGLQHTDTTQTRRYRTFTTCRPALQLHGRRIGNRHQFKAICSQCKNILLHTHIDILNLISLKNVTWHLKFSSINRWTLGRMVISNAHEKTPMEIPLKASRVSKSGYFQKCDMISIVYWIWIIMWYMLSDLN